jgi:hypothetical protein
MDGKRVGRLTKERLVASLRGPAHDGAQSPGYRRASIGTGSSYSPLFGFMIDL